MIFTDIRLQSYRSYEDASFELGPGVNIVVGPNAAGKTNLLEALLVSAVGTSYRAKDLSLIRVDDPWARIDVHTDSNQTRVVKIVRTSDGSAKTFEFDEKPYKRLTPAHRQPAVLFEPNDLFLLHDEPARRRDYIDDTIEQYISGYGALRVAYRRIVAQRNALLKRGPQGTSQLFAWNIRLSETAAQIVAQRNQFIDIINQKLVDVYSTIAQKQVDPQMVYKSKTSLENYSSTLMAQLERSVQTDIERGFTSYGPHRDDIVAHFAEKQAALSASRGEIRTLLLSLKILELQILEEKTGKRPLLLLDDVFSELDGARRRALTDFLKDYQAIITTTDADAVVQHFTEDYTIIPV